MYQKQEIPLGTVIVLGVPGIMPTDLLGKPTGHAVLPMAIFYYTGRAQSKISKGERCMGEAWRKLSTSFQVSSPMGSQRTRSVSPAMSSGQH